MIQGIGLDYRLIPYYHLSESLLYLLYPLYPLYHYIIISHEASPFSDPFFGQGKLLTSPDM